MRVLLFSDVHFSVDSRKEDERWFPSLIAGMPFRMTKRLLAKWDRIVQKDYHNFLKTAEQFGPYDFIISLGDNTTGDNERGMVSPRAQIQWRIFRERLEKTFPLVPKFFVWGGHDAGYSYRWWKRGWTKILPAIDLPDGRGMTKESFYIAQKLLGEPWQEIRIQKTALLLLNSEIIRASRESRSLKTRKFLVEMIKRQNLFIKQVLVASRNVVLMIHDPAQLEYIRKVFIPHFQKIRLTLAGHFHLETAGSLFCLKQFFRQVRLEVIPSTFGLLCVFVKCGRGGFGILNISENGKLRLEHYQL